MRWFYIWLCVLAEVVLTSNKSTVVRGPKLTFNFTVGSFRLVRGALPNGYLFKIGESGWFNAELLKVSFGSNGFVCDSD